MRNISIFTLFCSIGILAAVQAAPPDDAHGPIFLDNAPVSSPRRTTGVASDIRVNVDLTLVPVTVTDEFGTNISGLEKQNFQIYDGAEPRPIVSFSREDAPVSIGLVFDCSHSMRDKFEASREAASQLFQQLNPDQDEAFLVTISDRAILLRDFTSDFGQIGGALTFVHPDGSTSLLDGIYFAVSHMKQAHNPRKAVVIVSDGGDNNSRHSVRELLHQTQESDVLLYTILNFWNPQAPEEIEGPDLLAKLANKTGGRHFVGIDRNGIGQAMSAIGKTLHNQYVLGYYPPSDAPSGKYRKIRVKLQAPPPMPRLQVYARGGYYVP